MGDVNERSADDAARQEPGRIRRTLRFIGNLFDVDSLLLLGGAACVIVGVSMFEPRIALILGGLGLLAVPIMRRRRSEKRSD